jgi:hypothetical protein
MAKNKKNKKKYRTNETLISLNVERFSAELDPFPHAERWEGESTYWWTRPTDPRRLRKKGSQICKHLIKNLNDPTEGEEESHDKT